MLFHHFAELPGGSSLVRSVEFGYDAASQEMDKANEAADWQTAIGVVETLASVFHALPTLSVDGKPFGVGAGALWGFPNLANAVSAVGRGKKVHADSLSFNSSNAGRKVVFTRALQERNNQANAAGYELKQIDKQMTAQEIRITVRLLRCRQGWIARRRAALCRAEATGSGLT